MKQHHFVVYWNIDGEYIKKGHKRENFETYAEAFNWACRQVMGGFNFGVYQEQRPVVPKKPPRQVRLSVHTNVVFTTKE